MKRLTLLIFLLLTGALSNSCKDKYDQDPDNEYLGNVLPDKTDVKTYEIVNLIVHEDLADKYQATFGSSSIELLKTSDTTLTFYVPNISNGSVLLKFELATIRYNVAETAEIKVDQFITDITYNFDTQIESLNPSTTDEMEEVNRLKKDRQEVIQLCNSLTDDEKRQTILFYEANKEVFKSFATTRFTVLARPENVPSTQRIIQSSDAHQYMQELNNIFHSSNEYTNDLQIELKATTVMSSRSNCPKIDFKSYYGCTAETLGHAAVDLKNASKEFLGMLALAGVSAYLAPASFGLSAIGTTLALGTAGYLLFTEIRPAAIHFKNALISFLHANWIFTKSLFIVTAEIFHDQLSTSLNLKPSFRSITTNDSDINAGSGYFISAMNSLTEYWNKLKTLFGDLPAYKNTETPTILATNEIKISNISNANVQYLGNTGQSVKFKSLSGNEENFSYNITVSKEGFVEEKTLSGKVVPKRCDPSSIIGTWQVELYNTCYPNPDGTPAYSSTNTLILLEDGQSIWRYYDGSEYRGSYTYNPSNCTFSYNNVSWCSPTVSTENPSSLYSCGCLSMKHIKQ